MQTFTPSLPAPTSISFPLDPFIVPPEILQHLFLFFSPDGLGALSLVSRTWAGVLDSESLWKKLTIQRLGCNKLPHTSWRSTCANAVSELYACRKSIGLTDKNIFTKFVKFVLGSHLEMDDIKIVLALFPRREDLVALLVDVAATSGMLVVLERIFAHLSPHTELNARAFVMSSKGGHIKILERLLQSDPNLDINYLHEEQRGQYITALLAAVQNGHYDVTQFLLMRGAKNSVLTLQPRMYRGKRRNGFIGVRCTFSMALRLGFTEIAKLFVTIGNGQCQQERESELHAFLEEAVRVNQLEIVALLLPKSNVNHISGLSIADGVGVSLVPPRSNNVTAAKPNIQLNPVGPVLFQAAFVGNVDMAQFLLTCGADINRITTNQRSALHVACYYGHIKMAEFLINNGAEIDAVTSDGATPLTIANWRGHKALTLMLEQEIVRRKGKG